MINKTKEINIINKKVKLNETNFKRILISEININHKNIIRKFLSLDKQIKIENIRNIKILKNKKTVYTTQIKIKIEKNNLNII